MDEEVGSRIRAARAAAGRSQAELAADVGVSNSYLSHIEAGRRPISDDLLAAIAVALEVNVHHLTDPLTPDAREELQLRLRFAELSLRNGDWELAAGEYAAVRDAAPYPPTDELFIEATWGLAQAEVACGRLERAVELYELLLAEEPDGCLSGDRRLAVSKSLMWVYGECGVLDRAIELGEQVLSRVDPADPPDAGLLGELTATLAGNYLERGDLTRAALLIDQALKRSEQDGSLQARAAASWNAALIAHARCQWEEALDHADRARSLYAEIHNDRNVALLHVVAAALRLRSPEPDPATALAELEQADRGLREVGTTVDLGYLNTELARAHLMSGDPVRATEYAEQALAQLDDGDRLEQGPTLLVLGHVRTATGDTEASLAYYEGAARALETLGASRQSGRAWRELGEAFLRVGRLEDGVRALQRASDVLGIVSDAIPWSSGATLGDSVRLGDPPV